MEWKTWFVWSRKAEDDLLAIRERHQDLDTACLRADTWVENGHDTAVVKNADGDEVYRVGR
jgi:hypothetical protein